MTTTERQIFSKFIDTADYGTVVGVSVEEYHDDDFDIRFHNVELSVMANANTSFFTRININSIDPNDFRKLGELFIRAGVALEDRIDEVANIEATTNGD